MDTENKRKDARRPGTFIVYYSLHGKSLSYDVSQTKDISSGGLSLTTTQKFTKGEVLDLKITLPIMRESVKATAVVRDCREKVNNLIFITHLEFEVLETEQRKLIRDMVNFYNIRKK